MSISNKVSSTERFNKNKIYWIYFLLMPTINKKLSVSKIQETERLNKDSCWLLNSLRISPKNSGKCFSLLVNADN